MAEQRAPRPVVWISASIGVVALAAAAVFAVASGSDSTGCTSAVRHDHSVARLWNEAALDAIRRDLPAPTVHSRNLYHLSAAMWDAWAAYDEEAVGVFTSEAASAGDVTAAREEAISYAAFRVLEARYIESTGASDTIPELDGLMKDLCFPIDVTTNDGNSPAAVGNRIASVVLAQSADDGSHESDGYAESAYKPANPPLVVAESGADLVDPNRWQPLQLDFMISQNGIPVENGVQEFIGPHWGFVTPFASVADPVNGLPIDPGPPPLHGSTDSGNEYKLGAVEVVKFSSLLGAEGARMIDISPASLGNSPVGTNDGTGHRMNPVTGAPYEAVMVNEADFGRVIAEFWADGPDSETPPGHWNTLANSVSDDLSPDLRVGGTGEPVDRLSWDVMMYLALNGANHDAAIAAWGSKGWYDYVRPISMIRWMGGLGQSSDPSGPSFDERGLPLVEGLIEVVTAESSADGKRHYGLADHVGDIAIHAYAGSPPDGVEAVGGVTWIRAVDWVPYQAPTFVTPSFAAYVSGHSAFSRASAEVLTAMTGSPYFPGGLGEWPIPAGALEFESGPTGDVRLQWATYRDAADQAGLSRLYGGIHVRADDLNGRMMGEIVGIGAWEKARSHFGNLDD